MKHLLQSTIVLISFSLSLILFEFSCHKESVAISTTSVNKIIYNKGTSIYVANYDGSGEVKVNTTVPGANPRLSPDGTTIFFYGFSPSPQGIYSVKIDGSNLKLIVAGANELGGVY